MHFSFTLLAWAAARSVLAGQLDDICWDVRGVIDCENIQLPTGQTPKFCMPCGKIPFPQTKHANHP